MQAGMRLNSSLYASSAMMLLHAAAAATPEMAASGVSFELPAVTPAGRSLLQLVWDELELAQGDNKHLAFAAESATVGGVVYDTRCAPTEILRPFSRQLEKN